MNVDSGGNSTEHAPANQEPGGLPTYVKILLAIAVLVVVLIVVLDMLVIAGGL